MVPATSIQDTWRTAFQEATRCSPESFESFHHRWREGAEVTPVDIEFLAAPFVVASLAADQRFTAAKTAGLMNAIRRLAREAWSRRGTTFDAHFRQLKNLLAPDVSILRRRRNNPARVVTTCQRFERGDEIRPHEIVDLETAVYQQLASIKAPRVVTDASGGTSNWDEAVAHALAWLYESIAIRAVLPDRSPLAHRLTSIIQRIINDCCHAAHAEPQSRVDGQGHTVYPEYTPKALALARESELHILMEVVQVLLTELDGDGAPPLGFRLRRTGRLRTIVFLRKTISALGSNSRDPVESAIIAFLTADRSMLYGAFPVLVKWLRQQHPGLARSEDGVRRHLEKYREMLYERARESSAVVTANGFIIGGLPLSTYIREGGLKLSRQYDSAIHYALRLAAVVVSVFSVSLPLNCGEDDGHAVALEKLAMGQVSGKALADSATISHSQRAYRANDINRPESHTERLQGQDESIELQRWEALATQTIHYVYYGGQHALNSIRNLSITGDRLRMFGTSQRADYGSGQYSDGWSSSCDGVIRGSKAVIICKSWYNSGAGVDRDWFLLGTLDNDCVIWGDCWFAIDGDNDEHARSHPQMIYSYLGFAESFEIRGHECSQESPPLTGYFRQYDVDPYAFVQYVCDGRRSTQHVCGRAYRWLEEGLLPITRP